MSSANLLVGNAVIELIRIGPGTFRMGADDTESTGHVDQQPPHQVNVKQPFCLGRFPITQVQWSMIMGERPSAGNFAPLHPVDGVSWDDAQRFCQRASELANRNVRLPTEAQWEYACRAGTATNYYFGDHERDLPMHAWFDLNSMDSTHPVGQKMANPWGLHDMLGNVWEWCQDVWHSDYHRAPDDETAWTSGVEQQPRRVLRGGAWDIDAFRCRSAYRSRDWHHLATGKFGLRIVTDPFE